MNYDTAILFFTAILIASVYGFHWLRQETSAKRSIFKTLPVTILAIAAALSGQPILLIAALILSALGDLFLSREGEKMFLAGLGSFLIGHLAYSALFLTHIQAKPNNVILTIVCAVSALLVAGILKNLWRHLGTMKAAVTIYALAIGTMIITAWFSGQNNLLLAGVALFAISDTVLSHEIFVWKIPQTKRTASYIVWVTYFCAQAMILYSFWL